MGEFPQHLAGGIGGERCGIGDVDGEQALAAAAQPTDQDAIPGGGAPEGDIGVLHRRRQIDIVTVEVVRIAEVVQTGTGVGGKQRGRDIGEHLDTVLVQGVQHAVIGAHVGDARAQFIADRKGRVGC